MLYTGAKDNGALCAYIFHESVNNQVVAVRNKYLAFKIADIVPDTVKPNLCQVDIGMYSDAANRNKLPYFHRGFDIEAMSGCLEYFENILVVRTFGSGCQTECKRRLEVSKYLLIRFGGGVVRFVDDEIIKLAFSELFKIESNALNASGAML